MNKDKLNLTTTLNVGGEGFLQGLEVVRAWYLCASEPTEKRPFPSKTTSIKMYMDDNGVAYLAGDYIKDKYGEALMQFCQRGKQRDITIAHQSLQEKNVKVVIPKDPCISGKLEWDRISEYLTELGVEVVGAKGNRNLRLRKRFEPAEEAGFNILTDTFTNKDFLFLMQVLNQSEYGDLRRYGDEVLNVVSDAYNTLKFIKNEKQQEKQAMNTGIKTGANTGIKLHKVLQRVSLDSLGMFTQRITSAGYDLGEMEVLLHHKNFVGYTDEVERELDEAGKFIQRCCKAEGEDQFTIEEFIAILDKDFEGKGKEFELKLEGIKGYGVPVLKIPSCILEEVANNPDGEAALMVSDLTKASLKLANEKNSFTILPSDSEDVMVDFNMNGVEGTPVIKIPQSVLDEQLVGSIKTVMLSGDGYGVFPVSTEVFNALVSDKDIQEAYCGEVYSSNEAPLLKRIVKPVSRVFAHDDVTLIEMIKK